MRNGFYRVRRIDEEHGESDEVGFGVAILAHMKDGRIVGVDQGGCKLTGTYETGPDGTTSVRLAYAFKAGSPLPNGMLLERDTTVPSQFELAPSASDGVP